MRILTLCYEFPPLGGGGSRVVAGLSRELVAEGHSVDLVTMGFRGLPARETVDGIEVHRVPCVRLSRSVCTPPELASYLFAAVPYALRLTRQRAFDINHTHFIFPDGITALLLKARTGLPYVITAHGSDVRGFNPHRFRALHRLLLPAWRRVVARAESIVSPSRHLAELIRRGSSRASIELIPNGFDPRRYRADRPRTDRVLVVSRLLERKGVQHLVRGVQGLDLGCPIEIVGTGTYQETLETMSAGTGIRFRGWLDNDSAELRDLYETSTIFVLPSENENFPVVLLEAMAAGLAIVTTRGTGCDEVVGDAALLVNPGDPAELRRALVRLVGDPALRARLGQAARRRMEREYDWSSVAGRYLAAYRGRRPEQACASA
jgi:glycosyltransferase involved in cell wall biosynthesis